MMVVAKPSGLVVELPGLSHDWTRFVGTEPKKLQQNLPIVPGCE